MEKLKVKHDEQGDHNPLAAGKGITLTDAYELRNVTLKFVTIELNRASTHAVWSDTDTGKRYRTDVRHLEDAIKGDMPGALISVFGGCFITGSFGFKLVGAHVLLYILEPTPDEATQLDHIREICSRFLAGELKGHKFRQEIKQFMKS